MKTLELFNAVLAKDSEQTEPYIDFSEGFIIEPDAMWAKDEIITYYKSASINGEELNKTFHKSWAIIKDSNKEELVRAQALHYVTGYGSQFLDELYIPEEKLEVPIKLTFKVIKAYTKDSMIKKCLELLTSGIALKFETVKDVIYLMTKELGYEFTGDEGIKNKEAIVVLAEMFGIYPEDSVEFLRYIIYVSTGETLLIKNRGMVEALRRSSFNPGDTFKAYGLKNLAGIFNRFKPLFLAFKGKCPDVINKISKLSKKYHQPIIENPLNKVTSTQLNSELNHWLDNATVYSLMKALQSCYSRMNGQDTFTYAIRNGKSFVKEGKRKESVVAHNFKYLLKYMKGRFNLDGVKVFIPNNIQYGLPTSEKMYVGNIPMGTKFYGDKLAVGVHWRNEWGTSDFDVSGLNLGGKIGWNSTYNQDDGDLMYSGDITNAPNGATEYLYANSGLKEPTLVLNNQYYGAEDSQYKIIVGVGDNIDMPYMMDPNNLMVDVMTQMVQRQTILGLMLPEDSGQSFVLLNIGGGNLNVSYNNEVSNMYAKSIYQQYKNPLSLSKILIALGAEIVEDAEDVDFDLSLDMLEKDTFTRIFEGVKVI